jgi:uncharacterized membrane protein
MNKREFLQELRRSLRGYNSYDVEGIIRYYDEMISDNMDAGLSEYQAVAALGNINDIAGSIKAEFVESNMKATRFRSEHEPKAKPVKGFFSVMALCTSPLLILLAFVFSIVFLTLFITFFAVGIGIMIGGVGALIMTIVNAVYAASQIGTAGVLISIGIGMIVAAVLMLLGIAFYKLSIAIIKGFTKTFAHLVGKSKRRKVNNENIG